MPIIRTEEKREREFNKVKGGVDDNLTLFDH